MGRTVRVSFHFCFSISVELSKFQGTGNKWLFYGSEPVIIIIFSSIGIQSHHFMANRWGNYGNSDRLYFLGLWNHCRWWLQPWNEKMLAPWKKSYDQPRQHIKKQRHHFVNKGLCSQSYGLPSIHVWMWELDHKEDWVPKNWCFWTVVLRVPWTTRRSNR